MHVHVCAVIVHESGGDVGGRGAWGLWHNGWVDTLHNQGCSRVGVVLEEWWGGVAFTSATSAVPPYSLPTVASCTRLNWLYHMTGILSTQQEVALQTVCFALFLELELNGVRERVKQKERDRESDETNRNFRVDCIHSISMNRWNTDFLKLFVCTPFVKLRILKIQP